MTQTLMTSSPNGAPAYWECDVVLADGGTVHVRPIGPDDGDRLIAFHAGLSDETVFLRFFSAKPTLSLAEVERFTHVDHYSRVALVAELGDRLVGVARYDREPGTDSAEIAFVVSDGQQGRGIGTVLLEHLAAAARERGITRFVAQTLAHNGQMLGVLRAAGFTERTRVEGGVVHVELLIEPTDRARAAVEAREHRAEAASVARLLTPRSVAVIGASRNPDTVGHQVLRNLLAGGFAGPVYPVNPGAEQVASVKAYPTMLDIPGAVDLAVVAVPAVAVIEVVRQCAAKGVAGVVVLSAGFGEVGEVGVQDELRYLARRNGMRLVGPNCVGVANTAIGLDATFSPYAAEPGRIAMQSQSGALGIAILERSARIGLGVSSFVSVGNKADVSGNDLLQYWEDDPRTDVVLLYLESFGNPRKFARIARRLSRRKPIVAVKSGRSAAGVRAASSHTAAMASPDIAVDALFRQAGVIRVDTLDEMFDMAIVLGSQPLPEGHRVAIVGNSGGPGHSRHRRVRRGRTRGTRAVGGDAGCTACRGRPERRGVQSGGPGGVGDPRGVRAGARHRARRRHRRCGHRHLHPPSRPRRHASPRCCDGAPPPRTSRCSAASWPGPASRPCSEEKDERRRRARLRVTRAGRPGPGRAPRATPRGGCGRPARYPSWTASTPTAPARSSTRSSSARPRAAGCRPMR